MAYFKVQIMHFLGETEKTSQDTYVRWEVLITSMKIAEDESHLGYSAV
jgi:hypothetical protein